MVDSEESGQAIARHEFDLPTRPDPTDVWQEAKVTAQDVDIPEPRTIDATDRTAWYCPTATIYDAHRARELLDEYDVTTVYDLGADDCRVALWLAEQGYDVTAYEILEPLADAVSARFDVENFEVCARDYYEDYDDFASDGAVLAFGGTNELPYVPETGLAIEGYGEIGIRAHYNGEVMAAW